MSSLLHSLLSRWPVDIIIDFSSPSGVLYYGMEAARRGIAVLTAVSSYPDATHAHLRKMARQTRVLWSPNITLGVNLTILAAKIVRNLAPQADVQIIEQHFAAKAEVSGTARKIAQELSVTEESIRSVRAGGIVGVHEVLFGFPNETVRLTHESISREAFGTGVLFVLQHLLTEPNGLYSMEDLLLRHFQLPAGRLEPVAHQQGTVLGPA